MVEKIFGKSNNLFQKALFLDRDGVINIERGTFTWKKEDFLLLSGILKLTKKAQEKGYKIIIITNQSGVARGLYSHKDVAILHQYMRGLFQKESIQIDGIYYCPHHPGYNGNCFCRKPGSILIERAAAKFNVDTSQSFMFGDKERDLIAGKKAGCQTVWVGEGQPDFEADYAINFPNEFIPFL